MQILGEIFFCQSRRWNGRYAQHNNHFSNPCPIWQSVRRGRV